MPKKVPNKNDIKKEKLKELLKDRIPRLFDATPRGSIAQSNLEDLIEEIIETK